MKRVSMFLLPIAALLLLGVVFAYKWWNAKMLGLRPSPLPTNEGIEIEEGGRSLLKNFGMTEDNAVQLKDVSDETGLGVVQWSEDKKSVTVIANVDDVAGTQVQAWLQDKEGKLTKLGTLSKQKAGYLLEHRFMTALEEPTTLVISREKTNDNTIEEKLLEGQLSVK